MTPGVPAAPALRWQRAVIARIDRLTPRVVAVALDVALAPWQAGQHVDVRLTAEDGYTAQRSYSIATAPGAAHVELAIEQLDDGEVSPYFHDVAQPGDEVELRGPLGGHFIWRAEDGGPLLLVGGGSGIVPLMSIARHRAAVAAEVPALLVCSARTADEILFRDELVALETADPAFSLALATTRGAATRVQDFDRRLDRTLWDMLLARWGHAPRHVYVCGSNAFVEAMTRALVDSGQAPLQIRTERYGGAAA